MTIVKGTRIRLVHTTDPYTRLAPGTEGTVSFIDSLGTVNVNWDGGSTLGLVPGEDEFEVIGQPPCDFCGEHDHFAQSADECPNHDPFAVEAFNER